VLKTKNLHHGFLIVILTIIVAISAVSTVPTIPADVTWSEDAINYCDNYLGPPSYCILKESGMPSAFFEMAYDVVVTNATRHAEETDAVVDVEDLEWAMADYMVHVMGIFPTMEDAYAKITDWEVACGWKVHDVAVLNVSVTPTAVEPGQNATICVQVENHGNFTESFNVTVYADKNTAVVGDEIIVGTQSVVNLTVNTRKNLTFSWNTTGVPSSNTYTISAAASVIPYEFNTADNSLTNGTVTILGAGMDVAVWSVMTDTTKVYPGNLVEITVDVINEGSQQLTTNVTTKYNDSVIGTQLVSLAPGASTMLTYQWNTSMVSLGTYNISAEATPLVGETDLADNSKMDGTVTIQAVPESPKIEYVFIATGTWYQIGYEIGSYFSKEIISTAEELAETVNMSIAMNYYEQIKGMISPDVIEQMEGKAQGLADSAHINYSTAWRYVVMLDMLMDLLYLPMECTGWGCVSEDGTYLCHNTDGPYSRIGEPPYYSIIYKPRDADGQKIGHDFVGGSPYFEGIMLAQNDAGLAIVYNTVKQKDPRVGLPVNIMVRMVIYKCETFDQAVQMIQGFLATEGNSYGTQGANLLLIDFKTNRLARIEIASRKVTVTEATGYPKWIAATNHYISQPEENTPDLDPEGSTFIRYNRTLYLLENAVNRDYNYMSRMLSDHGPTGDPNNPSDGGVNTICNHRGEAGTFLSEIYTANGTKYYTILNPCLYCGKRQSFNWLKPFKIDSHYVGILSNSTIIGFCDLNFTVNGEVSQISFNISGPKGTVGYCEVSIPKDLMQGSFQVSIDNSEPFKPETQSNATHTILYFTYNHSVHTVTIISTGVCTAPFQWAWVITVIVVMVIVVAAILFAVIIRRKNNNYHPSFYSNSSATFPVHVCILIKAHLFMKAKNAFLYSKR